MKIVNKETKIVRADISLDIKEIEVLYNALQALISMGVDMSDMESTEAQIKQAEDLALSLWGILMGGAE